MAVNATAVWRVRPSGSNTNGGGYDPGISGAGTDYSQQDAAQASGTHGTTTGTTTFTDATALAFTSAMIGNAIYITGTGQTTGWYFVTARTSSSVVTLDRSPGTGTLATWHLGGGWADFWTNPTAAATPLAGGNIVYILGSGIPNPSSYTYDYTMSAQLAPLNSGVHYYLNDPSTPNYKAPPDTTGGMPCIKWTYAGNAISLTTGAIILKGLWFVATSTSGAGNAVLKITSGNSQGVYEGCVLDQLSYDISFFYLSNSQGDAGLCGLVLLGLEIFSSVGGTGTHYAVFTNAGGTVSIIGCNIHDVVGGGIGTGTGALVCIVNFSIIAKCGAIGILVANYDQFTIMSCTIDGNLGDGINISAADSNVYNTTIINNIISNHTQAGKYGLNAAFGSAAANYLSQIIDYNTYYNNTANLNNLNYGPHDTQLSTNPYVGQSTENYTLA